MSDPTRGSALILTWNVQWATRRSKRGSAVAERLGSFDADVVVVTEIGDLDLLPTGGHVVDAGDDWGYPTRPGRRKVAMWSRAPWRDATSYPNCGFPSGRLVAANTETDVGPLSVVGVCIPWRDAHVRTGRRDRDPWEDHLEYLDALRRLLDDLGDVPAVVGGDFNQRIPRTGQPKLAAEALAHTLEPAMHVATAGATVPAYGGRLLIDHIAHSRHLRSETADGFYGRDVSDHDGATARIVASEV